MADTVTLRNTGDAFVSNAAGNQKKNFSNTQKLYVKANNPDTRYGYLFFGRPFPLKAKILSAYLEVHNGTVIEGGTLSVQRISERWSRNKVTWNNRPNVAGPVASTTKNGNVPINTAWRVDLTQMLQQVSDGQPWFGVRFTMNDGKGEWFYGSAARNAALRPVLVIEYVESPDIPSNLSPANGNAIAVAKPDLLWEWVDDKGSTALQAVHVQIATNSSFTQGLWDSGWVTATEPELDLAATNYPGLAVGSTVYWRVQVRDGAGQSSAWSGVASFQRRDVPAVNLTAPIGPSGDAYVEESTPPISWDPVAGQVSWQVLIYDQDEGNEIIANSGKITGSQTDWTPPAKTKMLAQNWYTVDVRVWDNYTRERNSGIPPYAVGRKLFQVRFSAATNPVTSLEVTQIKPWQWARLKWTRGSAADQYEIYMNDRMIAKVDHADVEVEEGKWATTIRAVPPRRNVRWKVRPIINGKAAQDGPEVTTNFRILSASLSETNGANPVMFLNYERDQEEARQQSVHEVMGNFAPVLVKQAIRGKEGTFVGYLTGDAVPGVSAEEELRRFNALRKGEGRELLVTLLNESFECFISNSNVLGIADAKGVYYEVSFDYYQTDF